MELRPFRQQAVFGAADGVTIVLGLLVTLTGQPHALWRAALGAGLAEMVGMTAGQWLSDGESGFTVALANGGAAFAACLAPALPYLVLHGFTAMLTSLTLITLVATLIAWLRPERGLLAAAQTYGVLIVAAGLCAAAAII